MSRPPATNVSISRLNSDRLVALASNSLGAALFGITADPATRDRARHFFLNPAAREFFAYWTADAARLAGSIRLQPARAGSIRLQPARHPDDRWLTTLIGELSIKSAEFRTLWARHLVDEKGHGVKHFNHPVAGELMLTYERPAPAVRR